MGSAHGFACIGAKTLSERHARPDKRIRAVQPWDEDGISRASAIIRFCEDLTVTSGPLAGKKLKLRPWQRKFIGAIYAEDPIRGGRATRTAVLSMGRKNGKTQLAACLALAHLCGPEAEQRGEVYSCANDRFQAGKIFNEMEALIDHSPWLGERTNISRFKKEIKDLVNGSYYAALTAEAKTKMGLNPSFVVYDELGQATGRDLYDAMDSAMGGRKEPLMLIISTQAADDFAPMSVLVDYGIKVVGGELNDPAFHLTLYSAPDSADPWSIEAWEQANPALDDFRSLEDVKRMARNAQRMPSQENAFRNLILNQRVAAHTRFIETSFWKACSAEPKIPPGAKIYAGLDLGSTRDLSALSLCYVDLEGIANLQTICWIPGDPKARSEQEKAPYESWVRQGYLTHVGDSTDPAIIALKIAEVNGRNPIISLAFDRWRINDLKRELDNIGCAVTLEPHGQGFKDMSPAVDIVERLIIQKKIRHGGHPVLAMCLANAVVTRDPSGNRKFDKAKSKGRIDALVSTAMALSQAFIKQTKAVDIDSMIG